MISPALVWAAVGPSLPAQAPEAEAIRKATETILSQSMYQEVTMRRFAIDWDWLLDPLEDAWEAFMDTLQNMIGGLPLELQYVVYALMFAIVVGLIVHIAYTVRRAMRPPDIGPIITDHDGPPPAHVLESRAMAMADEGNYVDASRTLLEAALSMLEEKRHGRVRRGLTTNEYLQTFTADWVVENLRVFVDLINWKWYRARTFDAADFAECRAAFDRIRHRLEEEFS